MSNYGDTPDETPETPQDPFGQQPPSGEPDYGQPPAAPYGQPYGEAGGQPPYAGGNGPTGGRPFSIGDAFTYGWNKFKANLGPILIVALILFAAVAVLQVIQYMVTGGGDTTIEINQTTGEIESNSGGLVGGSILASLFFGGLSLLVQTVLEAGIVKGALDLTKGKAISIGSMFAGINWLQVFIAGVLVSIATLIGLVLCILPGLAVMFLTAFTLYFIVDKDMPAIEAIQASIKFVMANVGTLIVFFLACIGIVIAGALACGVGLLVAIPVVVIAQAYAYRTLQGEPVA